MNIKLPCKPATSEKGLLLFSKHSPEPSVHEVARNVQIIGTQCVIAVPVGVFNLLNMLPYCSKVPILNPLETIHSDIQHLLL